jgi:hypothetical protein
MRNRFQVCGIHAAPHAALVIEIFLVVLSDERGVRHRVCENKDSTLSNNAVPSVGATSR